MSRTQDMTKQQKKELRLNKQAENFAFTLHNITALKNGTYKPPTTNINPSAKKALEDINDRKEKLLHQYKKLGLTHTDAKRIANYQRKLELSGKDTIFDDDMTERIELANKRLFKGKSVSKITKPDTEVVEKAKQSVKSPAKKTTKSKVAKKDDVSEKEITEILDSDNSNDENENTSISDKKEDKSISESKLLELLNKIQARKAVPKQTVKKSLSKQSLKQEENPNHDYKTETEEIEDKPLEETNSGKEEEN
jgi:hypothetical protein